VAELRANSFSGDELNVQLETTADVGIREEFSDKELPGAVFTHHPNEHVGARHQGFLFLLGHGLLLALLLFGLLFLVLIASGGGVDEGDQIPNALGGFGSLAEVYATHPISPFTDVCIFVKVPQELHIYLS